MNKAIKTTEEVFDIIKEQFAEEIKSKAIDLISKEDVANVLAFYNQKPFFYMTSAYSNIKSASAIVRLDWSYAFRGHKSGRDKLIRLLNNNGFAYECYDVYLKK